MGLKWEKAQRKNSSAGVQPADGDDADRTYRRLGGDGGREDAVRGHRQEGYVGGLGMETGEVRVGGDRWGSWRGDKWGVWRRKRVGRVEAETGEARGGGKGCGAWRRKWEGLVRMETGGARGERGYCGALGRRRVVVVNSKEKW